MSWGSRGRLTTRRAVATVHERDAHGASPVEVCVRRVRGVIAGCVPGDLFYPTQPAYNRAEGADESGDAERHRAEEMEARAQRALSVVARFGR